MYMCVGARVCVCVCACVSVYVCACFITSYFFEHNLLFILHEKYNTGKWEEY